MKQLNAQQLAFILDIKKEDARAMMCNAWQRSRGIEKESDSLGFEKVRNAFWDEKNKVRDDFPQFIDIEILQKELNLPHLKQASDDIEQNYLTRKSSRKWILCDYPEKVEKKAVIDGKEARLKIPPALLSMLPHGAVHEIKAEWRKRFPKAIVV